MATITDIVSLDAFYAAVGSTSAAVVHYWAPWCEPCTFMDEVFRELAKSAPPTARFLRVEAEEVPDVSEIMDVAAVPFFTLHRDGAKVDAVEGAEAAQLSEKVRKLLGQKGARPASDSLPRPPAPPTPAAAHGDAPANGVNGPSSQPAATVATPFRADAAKGTGADLNLRLQRLTLSSPVMLFMKGSPDAPRCGFSARVVASLRALDVPFGHFDILQDQIVREGLKKFSDWPTFPQLYAGGELLGGADIIAAMADAGNLKPALDLAIAFVQPAVNSGEGLASVSVRVSSVPEGGPSSGAAGTADGDGKGAAGGMDEALRKRLEALIVAHPVMLFMKGTPDAPRCGFSRKVAAAVQATGHPFGFFNILTDEAVRQGIKAYGEWPTFPQLWVRGDLLGGCDIVQTLAAEGSLKTSIDDMLSA